MRHVRHTRTRRWRRLAVLAMAPLLALSATAATAQGVWVTTPPKPTAASGVGGAAADCPDGLRGTCVYAVGGTGDGKLEAYSPASGTWATLPSLKSPQRLLPATTTAPCPSGIKGDCVYAIGGFWTGIPQAPAEAYSTETNAWLTLPTPPTLRGGAAATAPCPDGLGLRGTCVYVIGGSDGVNPLATVEAYSPATNTWASLTPLQTARSGIGASAAPCPGALGLKGTCVYAIGGAGATGNLTSVEVYSPVLNAWQFVAPLPTARFTLSAATAPCPEGMSDGCVYALGGSDNGVTLSTAEAYSPVTNAWVTLPSIPTPRREFGAAAAPCPKNTKSDCVYAIGGFIDGATSTATTEAFAIEREAANPKPKPSTQPRPPADDPFPDSAVDAGPGTAS